MRRRRTSVSGAPCPGPDRPEPAPLPSSPATRPEDGVRRVVRAGGPRRPSGTGRPAAAAFAVALWLLGPTPAPAARFDPGDARPDAFYVEAENLDVGSGVQRFAAGRAANGGVIQVPITRAPDRGRARGEVKLGRGGTWQVWLRVAVASEIDVEHRSGRLPYAVTFAGRTVRDIPLPGAANGRFRWVRVSESDGRAVDFDVPEAGYRTLTLRHDRGPRLEPVQIDRIYFDNVARTGVRAPDNGADAPRGIDARPVGTGGPALNFADGFESVQGLAPELWKRYLVPSPDGSRTVAPDEGSDGRYHRALWRRDASRRPSFLGESFFRFGERAELVGTHGTGGDGTHTWYAFSMKIPADWRERAGSEDIVAQWRLEPASGQNESMPPPLAFVVNTSAGSGRSTFGIVNQYSLSSPWDRAPRSHRLYDRPLEDVAGRWIDWVVEARWGSTDASSYLRVWRDGEPLRLARGSTASTTARGANFYRDYRGNLEFKIGIYHTAGDDVRERQVFHDEVRVGNGGVVDLADLRRPVRPAVPADDVVAGTELVPDGDFERGTGSWIAGGRGGAGLSTSRGRLQISSLPGERYRRAKDVVTERRVDMADVGRASIARVRFTASTSVPAGQMLGVYLEPAVEAARTEAERTEARRRRTRFVPVRRGDMEPFSLDFALNYPAETGATLQLFSGGGSPEGSALYIDDVSVERILK